MTELPRVDPTLCTSCGDCVIACPTDCLHLPGAAPVLVRPAHCISCSLCVLVCPTNALRMDTPVEA